MSSTCTFLLPGQASLYLYWLAIFVLIASVIILIYCIIVSKLNPHILVLINALFTLLVMFISTLIVLSMHYVYGYNYTLLRDSRSTDVACILYSSFTISIVPQPSTSLILLATIHYRAVFWSKYSSKINNKQILLPILLIWLTTILLSALWTSFHEQHTGWYCLPFSGSLFSIVLQSVITVICLICLVLFLRYYIEIIIYLNKEELRLKAMRSRKFSQTRMFIIRLAITMVIHITQLVLMNLMFWYPLLGVSDSATAMLYVSYMLTVAITDIYMHAYIIIRKRYPVFRNKLHKFLNAIYENVSVAFKL